MSTELVPVGVQGVIESKPDPFLPVLVERAGGAARFAWDEFFYAEHHNPHTQKAYMAAVKRFLSWCEGQGVELPGVTPGMVGQYLVEPGRLAVQAKPAPVGVAGLLRPAGESPCGDPESGGVGAWRQRTGDRGQDAGNHRGAGPHAAGLGGYRARRRACGIGPSSPRWPIPPAGPGRSPSCGCKISRVTARSTCCGFRRRGARAGKSRCGMIWKGISGPISMRRGLRRKPRNGRCSAPRCGVRSN